ncbi:hypothetical protein BOTNAR_0031g00120 [Botryotinia narcissicola]|uniref:Uncharacterized protein n=1 Tax=Botryotinia narcissicola TaxID=278944 RepID=A0A4Z1JGE2_9HELO|nr:hypothetical protein BOTNAR_0031g00120 [Botryotinia narcissicola]
MGPKIGPMKAALAKTGKAYTRSIGDQRSDMDPPAQVSGVDPKKPARKRKMSCVARFGASADAMIQIMYMKRVEMYTGFLPIVSDIGPVIHISMSSELYRQDKNSPANNAPSPNPTRNNPVANDSATSLTPKSSAACVNAALSIDDANPTMNPIDAIMMVQKPRRHIDQLCGFM